MKQHLNYDVAIIGGGIIGLSIAISLQQVGKTVIIIDRDDELINASRKNAGAFAFADIVPLATPDIIKSAPKWLLDREGPLYIHPAYLLPIFPWMIRFWRASWNNRFTHLLEAQACLMALSREALERQVKELDAEFLLYRKGQLRLYQHKRNFDKSSVLWDACSRYNVRHTLFNSAEQITEIQPGLNPKYRYAGFTPDWINVSDPNIWVQYIQDIFIARGGKWLEKSAKMVTPNENDVLIRMQESAVSASFCIIAAGAWSQKLASSIGDEIPLDTERGYNITLQNTGFDLKTHLTFAEHGFVISMTNQGIRVGGAVEFAGLIRPPNFNRVDTLMKKTKKILPGLANSRSDDKWMGFRPSLPDSLPVIDYSTKSKRVIYAFGHGHLGLTQAAGTAELVRDLVIGKRPEINISAFSVKRF
jgi:D-amino-acid dehydrogenase